MWLDLYLIRQETHYETLRRNSIHISASGAIAWLWGHGNLVELTHITQAGPAR